MKSDVELVTISQNDECNKHKEKLISYVNVNINKYPCLVVNIQTFALEIQ